MGCARRGTLYHERNSYLFVKFVFQDKTRVARDLSGLVNEAYITLLQPLSRIHYILSQHNLGVSETDQLDDPHLITEVIEMREALEDASGESEVEDIKKDIAGLCMTSRRLRWLTIM